MSDLSLYARQLLTRVQVPEVLAGSVQARVDAICTELRDNPEFMNLYGGISVQSYVNGAAWLDDADMIGMVKQTASEHGWSEVYSLKGRDLHRYIMNYRMRCHETRKERRAFARESKAAAPRGSLND